MVTQMIGLARLVVMSESGGMSSPLEREEEETAYGPAMCGSRRKTSALSTAGSSLLQQIGIKGRFEVEIKPGHAMVCAGMQVPSIRYDFVNSMEK